MRESTMYTHIKNALKDDYFIQRVENGIDVGTPDVYFSRKSEHARLQGWIELKCLETLPARDATKIRVPFRAGQYAWYKRAIEADIHYFLLFWTPRGYYIFNRRTVQKEYAQEDFYGAPHFETLKQSTENEGAYCGLSDYLDSLSERK